MKNLQSKAEELLEHKGKNVPRGPFNTVLSFVDEAKGAIMKDLDGVEYIDFVGAIGTQNVGHCPRKWSKLLKISLTSTSIPVSRRVEPNGTRF
ncbi:aminotransferase class III-fold pyridoxal phosphate-dependent enzyme [Pseudalkalibacillus caeni]|uniref:aminotransferase class III-fold pyridoxal phosphate-dependent enzyme n=1 Tax=Exobacillus caeni TaxID=2574798 RepID=UPI001FE78D59|nr:aminotransferase class III-fold pyridoxal phosphate-dependent enzyme [Pseudalkalibacillus caeni]